MVRNRHAGSPHTSRRCAPIRKHAGPNRTAGGSAKDHTTPPTRTELNRLFAAGRTLSEANDAPLEHPLREVLTTAICPADNHNAETAPAMSNTTTKTTGTPCEQCPWRVANHGKRHPGGFYRKDNLRRLWNQIRKGGGIQSCHPTDPSHEDHQYAGAKPGARPLECIGSVILVLREMRYADTLDGDTSAGELSVTDFERYMAETRQRQGLTRDGLLYHSFQRAIPRPFGDGTPLPAAAEELLDSPAYGRPGEPPLQTTAEAKRDPAGTTTPD